MTEAQKWTKHYIRWPSDPTGLKLKFLRILHQPRSNRFVIVNQDREPFSFRFLIPISHFRRQNKWPIHQCNSLRIIWHRFRVKRHRQSKLDFVTRLPFPFDNYIRRWLDGLCHDLSINFNTYRTSRPTGMSDCNFVGSRFPILHGQSNISVVGKNSVHRELLTLICYFACNKQVDVQPRSARKKVDAVSVFGVVLHPRAMATGEVVKRTAIRTSRTSAQRHKVSDPASLRVLRSKDMVEMSLFVVVGIFGFRLPFKQMSRQLEHVVGITGLTGIARKSIAQFTRLAKVFMVAIPTNRISVPMDHGFPKELRRFGETIIRRNFRNSSQTNDLWNLCVRVLTRQIIFTLCQGIQNPMIIKLFSEVQIRCLSRNSIKLSQRVIHPTVLTSEHLFPLLRSQVLCFLNHPVCKALGNFQSRIAICKLECINKSCQNFVMRIPRGPEPIQIEPMAPNIALLDFSPNPISIWHRCDISVLAILLTRRQFRNNVIKLRLQFWIATTGKFLRASAEKMPKRMPSKPRVFPSAINLALRLQAGVLAKAVKQPIGIYGLKVLNGQSICIGKRPRKQANIGEREWLNTHRQLLGFRECSNGDDGQHCNNQSGGHDQMIPTT